MEAGIIYHSRGTRINKFQRLITCCVGVEFARKIAKTLRLFYVIKFLRVVKVLRLF